jgi:enoyl-CoA hydratase
MTEHHEGIRVEVAAGVARITLDRSPVNAFTLAMYRALGVVFDELGNSDVVRCIVLGGAGEKAFSAGFDFKLFSASQAEDDPVRPHVLREMLEAVQRCRLPVIAAVNGAALGAGCVLAAASDICVACEEARFSLPEIDFDRVGGSAYVGSRTTRGFVRYMALTGRMVGAAQAHRAGLVDFVLPRAELGAFVDAMAADIAKKSAAVIRHTKQALNRIEDLPAREGYEIEQMHSMMARAGLRDNAR